MTTYHYSDPRSPEPHGVRVLKRLHDDAAGILHEYDEFHDAADDDKIKSLFQKGAFA